MHEIIGLSIGAAVLCWMLFGHEIYHGAEDDRVLDLMKQGKGPMRYVDYQGRLHFNVDKYLRSAKGRATLEAFKKIPVEPRR